MRAVALSIGALAAIAIVTGLSPLGDGDDEAPPPANSADRLIFWAGCEDVASLSDAQLGAWQDQGVDGFVCMVGRLRGMGGSQELTGDPDADLSGETYSLERSLRDSGIVERADQRGMKLYLGAYLANYYNPATPLEDWFDDGAWAQTALPRLRELAGAAKLLGFAGVALDQELYGQTGGVQTATWAWDYPGNTHTEAEVRAQATQRGEEVMSAVLGAFPGAELAVYHYSFPGDWNELVHREVNGTEDSAADLLHIDFWDGMTSVEGYEAIRFYDNIFYKTPHRGTWESALTYGQNQTFATFSRRLSNWDYASDHVYVSPFSWIDAGPDESSPFDDARPPDYVAEQLLAFRKWGMGGEFANYAYRPLDGFDYGPYADAMRSASSPARVDGLPPKLIGASSAGGEITGTAHDNLAIKAVRWSDDRGGSGAAELSWQVRSGGYRTSYDWRMRWVIPGAEITPGATKVTITAEDIKGNRSAPAVAGVG